MSQLPRTPHEYALACIPIAHKMANRVQRNESEHMDLVQTSMVVLMEVVARAEKAGKVIQNPFAWAKKVIGLAMRDYYHVAAERLEVNVEDPIHITFSGEDAFVGEIFLDAYFSELEKVLGRQARILAENLVHPGQEVVDIALREMRSKAEAHGKGKVVRGALTLRVTQEHIRQVLGVRQREFVELLRAVRVYTSANWVTPTVAV